LSEAREHLSYLTSETSYQGSKDTDFKITIYFTNTGTPNK